MFSEFARYRVVPGNGPFAANFVPLGGFYNGGRASNTALFRPGIRALLHIKRVLLVTRMDKEPKSYRLSR